MSLFRSSFKIIYSRKSESFQKTLQDRVTCTLFNTRHHHLTSKTKKNWRRSSLWSNCSPEKVVTQITISVGEVRAKNKVVRAKKIWSPTYAQLKTRMKQWYGPSKSQESIVLFSIYSTRRQQITMERYGSLLVRSNLPSAGNDRGSVGSPNLSIYRLTEWCGTCRSQQIQLKQNISALLSEKIDLVLCVFSLLQF